MILAYLPNNIRVERQAYGRAGRSGEKGSARLIFQAKDEADSFGKALLNGELPKVPLPPHCRGDGVRGGGGFGQSACPSEQIRAMAYWLDKERDGARAVPAGLRALLQKHYATRDRREIQRVAAVRASYESGIREKEEFFTRSPSTIKKPM